jgi:hypothetical protein
VIGFGAVGFAALLAYKLLPSYCCSTPLRLR